MSDVDGDFDPQDVAEVLDESNLTEAGTDFVTFEEIEDDNVKDLTQLIGDTDAQAAEALDEDEFDPDAIDDEDLEEDEDSPSEVSDAVAGEDLGGEYDDLDPDELDGVAELEDDEVELEYSGDLAGMEHARSSAKPYESTRELTDADLQELGYQDEEGNTK